MPVTRTLHNGQLLTDWTLEVNEIDNQYGLVNAMGLFDGQGVSQESVIFNKNYITRTLIPQVSKRGGGHTKGKDRKVDTFSLALPYFNHQDYVTPQDVQGWNSSPLSDRPKMLATAIADKWEDMRMDYDQTREYMKIRALTGVSVDPEGNELANMHSLFGDTQVSIGFDLGNASANIDGSISTLKRTLAKTAKSGGKIGAYEVMVTPEFFDLLVNHPKMREAYLYYSASAQSDVVRADMARFEAWGVVDTFKHKGVTFFSYDAEFNVEVDDAIEVLRWDNTLDAGTVVKDFDGTIKDAGGYTIIKGMKGLYRGYYGPANTLSGANAVGSETFAYQYRDPKDKYHELELESAPLYVMTRPQLSIRVHADA